MHIKYEIFEDRDEGDFCNIEKAQVETCTQSLIPGIPISFQRNPDTHFQDALDVQEIHFDRNNVS